MADEEVFWYHPDPSTVDTWEFEFFNIQSGQWTPVEELGAVYPCDKCFQTVVEIPEFHCCIRSRAVNDAGPSEWSEPRALPEPGLSSLFLVIAVFVAVRPLVRRIRARVRQLLVGKEESPKDNESSGEFFGR